jgi:hypothetical protein
MIINNIVCPDKLLTEYLLYRLSKFVVKLNGSDGFL